MTPEQKKQAIKTAEGTISDLRERRGILSNAADRARQQADMNKDAVADLDAAIATQEALILLLGTDADQP